MIKYLVNFMMEKMSISFNNFCIFCLHYPLEWTMWIYFRRFLRCKNIFFSITCIKFCRLQFKFIVLLNAILGQIAHIKSTYLQVEELIQAGCQKSLVSSLEIPRIFSTCKYPSVFISIYFVERIRCFQIKLSDWDKHLY